MKKLLALVLAAIMVLAVAAPVLAEGETFLWDNFDDRDPNNKPELAPNGANMWWDNWQNLRAKNEDGAIRSTIGPRPSIRKTMTARTTTMPTLPTGWATGARP